MALALADGLWHELVLTPKPGLVDLEDSGSHPDLTFDLMVQSIGSVRAALLAISASLVRAEPLQSQVDIARDAERRMFAKYGTNTHKGALFLGGVLLVALDRAGAVEEALLRRAVAKTAEALGPLLAIDGTNGAAARSRFGVGGILSEVSRGMPSLFDVALPAYRASVARGESGEVSCFRMLAGLMQTVEDTTALHRCGEQGLAIVHADGVHLARLLDQGRAIAFLRDRNASYRRMNLTMGGIADLLGIACGYIGYVG